MLIIIPSDAVHLAARAGRSPNVGTTVMTMMSQHSTALIEK